MGVAIKWVARFLFLATLVLAVVGSLFVSAKTAQASAASVFTYQARIMDSQGNPIADGNYSMKFSLYTAASGGTPVWTASGVVATPSAITVHATNSLVTVYLGDTAAGHNPLTSVDWSVSDLYLGITIGSDSEMSPRRRLASTPQAFFADTANKLQGMYASSTASSGESLFTIHQTTNDAASSVRTALEVRSRGTSNEFDYLIRGVNSDGSTVFSLNRAGTVTTTNIIATGAVQGASVSSTSIAATSVVAASSTFTANVELRGTVTSKLAGNLEISTLSTINPTTAVSSTSMQLVGSLLFVQGTSTIAIFDVSDPSAPQQLSTITAAGVIGGFIAQGRHLYIVSDPDGGSGPVIQVYNYRVPNSPSQASSSSLSELTQLTGGVDVLLRDQALYIVGRYDQKLLVLDARAPADLTVIRQTALTDTPIKAKLHDHYILLLSRSSAAQSILGRIDVFDPFEPGGLSASADLGKGATDFTVRNATAYVSLATGNEVSIVTLNEATPREVGTLTGVTGAGAVFENGGVLFAYGSGLGGFRMYNTASSTSPTLIGVTSTTGQVRAFEQTGTALIVGTDASPYISFVRLPGIIVNAFQGGTGSFGTVNTLGGLTVGRDARVDGSLAVGVGGLYVAGTSRFAGYSTTGSAVSIVNPALPSEAKSWGLYTNRLLVGESDSATGTVSYVSVFGYDTSQSHNGICMDNLSTATTCPEYSSSGSYSLIADDAVGANAFDLAERYEVTGGAEPGDVLVLDRDGDMRMKKSPGREYDPDLSGVVSTRPGFVLGVGGETAVALAGRVPVKVTIANGTIAVGDPLTSSAVPGIAMKATKAGAIIGRALQSAAEDGLIEVYLQPGFDATMLLRADGSLTTVAQDIAIGAVGTASVETQTFDSRVISFLGSSWDGSQSLASEFRLFNDVRSSTSSIFTVAGASSSLFTVDSNGSASVSQDLIIGGKLYPSARGQAQRESYLFLDDTEAGARYISTNADGWQSMDGYDYAERYVSPDKLEPGDVVTVRRSDRIYVQRTLDERSMVVGIVSTKPGFIAGRPQDDAYPIALAGRVPTKVSSINGAIQAGDVLAPSSIPGVAVKATQPGPTIGLALEDFAGNDVGNIEVFVNPGWWGGPASEADSAVGGVFQQGFAQITMGQTRVIVRFSGMSRYPNVQVTPYTQIESGWWIQDVSSEGFKIVLGAPIGRSARFAWQAKEVVGEQSVAMSSGMVFAMDPITGELQIPPGQDETTKPKNKAEAIKDVQEVKEVQEVQEKTEAQPVEAATPPAPDPVEGDGESDTEHPSSDAPDSGNPVQPTTNVDGSSNTDTEPVSTEPVTSEPAVAEPAAPEPEISSPSTSQEAAPISTESPAAPPAPPTESQNGSE